MNNAEIKELSLKDLKDTLRQERDNLVKMKIGHAVSPIDKPHVIRDSKRTIARLLTELKLRGLAENK
jgi:large subunit ribosomal protein L29